MWIRELYIQNFQVIRRAELTFSPDHKVIGVVARYDDPSHEGRSNRGGKSTFVDAIEYLLYGVGRKRSHKDLINRAARDAGESMVVRGTLVFNDDSEVTVTRIRDNDGSPSVEVTGREGLKWAAVNEYMEELIGFTHDENRNTAYFSQGQIHKFMESEPRDKRKLLLTWLNQERWEVRRKYAKDEADKHSRKVEALDTALKSLPEMEDDPERLEDLLADTKDEMEELQGYREHLEGDLKNLAAELRDAREAVRLEAERKRLNAQASRLEEQLEAATVAAKRAAEIAEALEAARAAWATESETLTAGVDEAKERAAEARQLAATARKRACAIRDTGGVCPVLDEGCDRVGDSERDDQEGRAMVAATKAATLEAEVKTAAGVLVEARGRYTVKVNKLTEERDALGNTDVDYYQGELDRIDAELETLNGKAISEARSVDEIQANIEEQRGVLDRTVEELGSWRQKAKGYEDEIRRAKEYAERKSKLEQDLTFRKGMTAAWSYCAYMFGNRGIPAEHIKAAFESLEADVNYILDRLNSGLTVEFKPYREGKAKEKYCLVCGAEFQSRQRKCGECGEERQNKLVEQLVLTIHDTMENQVSDFELDSGGGKVLISFAVRLALLFLKVRANRGEVPPIILDEVVGMLDPVNRQAIINIVVNILTQEYGVRQIFWISHNEEILDLLENALCVTRFSDHSLVDWL